MQLLDVNIVGKHGIKHILISDGKIRNVANENKSLPLTRSEFRFEFEGALVFPGLINSHDHLDFNLFPQIGNKIYQNYVEWGADIHLENIDQIYSILKVPESLRIKWGLYKNLLAGITTVVNHGKRIRVDTELMNVIQECQAIHSIKREGNWRFRLNEFYRGKQPVVIHIGEGTDESSHHEIDQLLNWNFFRRELIGIHCVAMSEKQASKFKALIWCPATNDFLLGKTAAIDILKRQAVILFGTDSTLTAPWNIWDHLRLARDKNLVSDRELFDMLTISPVTTWNLKDTGQLAENKWADVVVAKPGNASGNWDAFYNLNPENILLILHRGRVRLFDAELLGKIKKANIPVGKFSRIYVNGIQKYVQGNLPGLMQETQEYDPGIIFPVSCA